MADDENRAAIAPQEFLQPQHAFEIEIVRRLVEQQKIGRCEEDRRQRHAHAPAAGEFGAGPQLLLRPKSRDRREWTPRGPAPNRHRSLRGGHGCRQVYGGSVSVSDSARSCVRSGVGRQHGVEQARGAARRLLRDRADAPAGRLGNLAADRAAASRRISFSSVDLAGAVAARRVPTRRPGRQACGRARENLAAGNPVCDVVDRSMHHVTARVMGRRLLPRLAAKPSRFYKAPLSR